MSVNAINNQMKLQDIQSGRSNDSSSIEQKIEQLRRQLEQVKKNKQLSPEEKEKRSKNIQKQIENLEKQKVQVAKEEKQEDASTVNSKEIQDVEKAVLENQLKSTDQSLDTKRRFDTFEHQPESQVTGVYELSHDEEGRPVIKFDVPSKDTVEKAPATNSEDSEKPQLVKTTVNTDAVDREIEQLKSSLNETKQKLSSTSDPKEKELLNNNLSRLEAELKQKDSDTYRRQHGQIIEQKVVSKIGE